MFKVVTYSEMPELTSSGAVTYEYNNVSVTALALSLEMLNSKVACMVITPEKPVPKLARGGTYCEMID